eukprot:TRINITY_DN22740_c0_g1_i2.p1 TRINITY_DN22740_c0_g1~~TRINITY_DN22740_c0_g1_i2.p1  ORF type:complete len:131 (+),score=9.95 TRINITY_DN22740_c0_g1_i2:35-427(+)
MASPDVLLGSAAWVRPAGPKLARPGLINSRSSSSSWFCNKTCNQKPAPVRISSSPSSAGTARRKYDGDGYPPPVPAKSVVLFSCSFSIYSSFYSSTSERGPNHCNVALLMHTPSPGSFFSNESSIELQSL